MNASGGVDAAVLVPLYGWPERPGLVFTERRHDLRRHAGEISFPGGRRDEGESYLRTALREAHEEIGLDPDVVDVLGALPPIGTFVTNYKVHPIVGLIEADLEYVVSPTEVESILAFEIDDAPRELRDAPARPPRAPDPHPHLRGRRPPHLGRDRAHPRRPARAAARSLSCADGCGWRMAAWGLQFQSTWPTTSEKSLDDLTVAELRERASASSRSPAAAR